MREFEEHLNSLLVDTFNSILKYEEMSLRTVSDIPITVTEAHLIEAIAKTGSNTSVSEIASSLGIAMPTATVAVKKLESKGFVTKLPSNEDGRRLVVALTELGKRVERAHGIFHRRMVRNIAGCFNEAEKEVLLTAIKKLSLFFREKVEV